MQVTSNLPTGPTTPGIPCLKRVLRSATCVASCCLPVCLLPTYLLIPTYPPGGSHTITNSAAAVAGASEARFVCDAMMSSISRTPPPPTRRRPPPPSHRRALCQSVCVRLSSGSPLHPRAAMAASEERCRLRCPY